MGGWGPLAFSCPGLLQGVCLPLRFCSTRVPSQTRPVYTELCRPVVCVALIDVCCLEGRMQALFGRTLGVGVYRSP